MLPNLATRSPSPHHRIATAEHYLRQLEPCLAGDVCPSHLFPQLTRTEWQATLKDAADQLTWRDPAMTVQHHASAAELFDSSEGAVPKNAALVFEAIVTTSQLDREGDILHTAGALPDLNMPLLWQHLPFEPIGKLLAVTRHNMQQLAARFAIIDSPLGRDVAQLVEFGALRISHGFRPLKYAPRKDDQQRPTEGWEIQEFEIVETSLVSVPANTDAVITALSQSELHHPATKSWAEHLTHNVSPLASARQLAARLQDQPLTAKTTTNLNRLLSEAHELF